MEQHPYMQGIKFSIRKINWFCIRPCGICLMSSQDRTRTYFSAWLKCRYHNKLFNKIFNIGWKNSFQAFTEFMRHFFPLDSNMEKTDYLVDGDKAENLQINMWAIKTRKTLNAMESFNYTIIMYLTVIVQGYFLKSFTQIIS